MLDVCLLGCGGMMPLPYRWLTSLMTRFNGSSLLIDCGEGTQIAIKEKGWSNKMLAARWGCTEVWVSKIINDENRKVQWNDAINGLPVISDNMI